jgi:hypothetical protein
VIVLALLALQLMSGCGINEKDEEPKVKEPVCGLVDEDLVRGVVGDHEIHASTTVLDDPDVAGEKYYECQVSDAETHSMFLSVTVSAVADESKTLKTMAEREKKNYGQESTVVFDGDPGKGFGSTFGASASWPYGAEVSVIRGERAYDIIVYNWPEVDSEERLALAAEMVKNIEENLADESENPSTDSSLPNGGSAEDGGSTFAASSLAKRLG